MTYYNTIGEIGKTLKENIEKAKTQDERLKLIIHAYPRNRTFTTQILHTAYEQLYKKAKESSIVRSVNTLKNEGFIEETGNKVKGQYGRNVLELKKA